MKQLATLMNNIEVEMIKELFEDNDIPLFVQHRETGEFMTIYLGNTIFGIDLFVHDEEYDQAKLLYDSFFSGQFEAEENE
jgi:hypothetical protein